MLIPSGTCHYPSDGKWSLRKEFVSGLERDELNREYVPVTKYWWVLKRQQSVIALGPDFDYICKFLKNKLKE